MKIIFLDFDGVLNSNDFFRKRTSDGFGAAQIDPELVTRLDKIVGSTGAKIVISSSWRHIWSIQELGNILRQAGSKIAHRQIIDRTPVGESNRGQEIKEWLDLDPEKEAINPDHEAVDSFVILDDENDMLPEQQSNFVHVNAQVGLTDDNVVDAIAILRMKL